MKLEAVLCVPHGALLTEIRGMRGFIPFDGKHLQISVVDRLFTPENLWFVPRPHAEQDDSYKQVIPYLVLRYGDLIATYRRTQATGEERLREKYSIGVGGHMNVSDAFVRGDESIDFTTTIATATTRELTEEVGLTYTDIISIEDIGLIYDDKDAVGRVHLGYVRLLGLAKPSVLSNEDALDKVRLTGKAALLEYYDRMEGWSQIVTDYILKNKETSL